MTIDPDVRGTANQWAHSKEFAQLLQAVVRAEGNILKAVQCSVNVTTREEALRVLARSATHAMVDFIIQHGHQDAFVAEWAKHWAPIGAANDQTGLNANWTGNVQQFWKSA